MARFIEVTHIDWDLRRIPMMVNADDIVTIRGYSNTAEGIQTVMTIAGGQSIRVEESYGDIRALLDSARA
jgi:hypothetical protein